MPLVVGFDLDMTLADPRRGVVASFAALSAETGVTVDGELAASRLGPPLADELRLWFDADAPIDALADAYRRHFAEVGVAGTVLLPGAREALQAVHGHGGRTLVVTSKAEHLARATLERLGLTPLVDVVEGWRWAEAKAEVLVAHLADVYVGDHLGDIVAARAAGATAVSVATGPIAAAELARAGADVVLGDLTGFPAWLAGRAGRGWAAATGRPPTP